MRIALPFSDAELFEAGDPAGHVLFCEDQSPGQRAADPAFGVRDISQATGIGPLGKTDLFLLKDGTRVFAP